MKKLLSYFCLPLFSKSSEFQSLLKRIYTIPRLVVVVIGMVFILFSACAYYRVTTNSYPEPISIVPYTAVNKLFIVHSDSGVYVMNNCRVLRDSISGELVADYYQFPYKKKTFPEENSSNTYNRNKGDSRLADEVHMYLLPGAISHANCTKIAVKDIYRFDIYKHDSKKTTNVALLSFFGVILSPFIILILVFAFLIITGSSCPYIYVNTGHGYVFAGEIYSGAVYAPLERNDYLSLPELVAVNGKYLLKITNELKEVQHTNLTELLVIDHPEKSEVLIDKYGVCQTSVSVATVKSATNFTGTDVFQLVANKDTLCYYGVTPEKQSPLTDGVIMSFDIPANAKTAKVFIRARNSIWLDNVYRNFHEMLGSYNDKWTEKQNNTDAKKLTDWSISQKIPLLLYIEKNGEWVYCDNFNMAGPMAFKEDVIAVDLKGISNGPLRIKLESGSFFWEIDFVGIDYSNNIPVEIAVVKLDNAVTEDQTIVTPLLKSDDSDYYVQPESDNAAELSFTAPALKNAKRTVILHSKGYYQIIQESKGFPKIKKLKEIRKSGKFLEYSRKLMLGEIDSLQIRQN